MDDAGYDFPGEHICCIIHNCDKSAAPKGMCRFAAGFRRRVAGCTDRDNGFARTAQMQRKLTASRTGNDDGCHLARKHCLPPLEKRPVDAS